MTDAAFLGAMALILAGGAAGAWMLRRAWRQGSKKGSNNGSNSARWRWAGWATLLATLIWPGFVMGAARGPFIAIMLVSAAAFVVVASGLEVRAARAPRAARESLAPEPADRPTTRWRTTLRWLLAGPIGMIAAMAVGICYAVWAPGETHTRLLVGGLMVPVVWGGAMAWTLADSRIVRATAVLVGTSVAGFGLAILRGFA